MIFFKFIQAYNYIIYNIIQYNKQIYKYVVFNCNIVITI